MSNGQLYEKYAAYYDKIYAYVDYEGESEFINWAVNKHKTSSGVELLDAVSYTHLILNVHLITRVQIKVIQKYYQKNISKSILIISEINKIKFII